VGKKKLTRAEKIAMTKERKCWKCNGELLREDTAMVCKNCGNKIER
jgi:predicted RNA-binding Zn-ribbon protein involved in translation (DUF1610 family)